MNTSCARAWKKFECVLSSRFLIVYHIAYTCIAYKCTVDMHRRHCTLTQLPVLCTLLLLCHLYFHSSWSFFIRIVHSFSFGGPLCARIQLHFGVLVCTWCWFDYIKLYDVSLHIELSSPLNKTTTTTLLHMAKTTTTTKHWRGRVLSTNMKLLAAIKYAVE